MKKRLIVAAPNTAQQPELVRNLLSLAIRVEDCFIQGGSKAGTDYTPVDIWNLAFLLYTSQEIEEELRKIGDTLSSGKESFYALLLERLRYVKNG